MPLKRKRGNNSKSTIPMDISQEILSGEALRAVIHRIMQFNIDPEDSDVSDVEVNLSKFNYEHFAPLVGLNPDLVLGDISTFEIHRSRIPTQIFKSIVIDMDIMTAQYGPPHNHMTEGARSRFFSPIFNHLVNQFAFMFRNNPKTIKDKTGTRGCIGYFFKAFGVIAILCIEMLPRVENQEERLNGISRVIAECDGCDLNNTKRAISIPIFCIFSDGSTFEFFKFEKDGSGPSFSRGCFLGDPQHLRRGLMLPKTYALVTPLPFIVQLRCICETIFDTTLSAYISALKSYASTGKKNGPSLDICDQAIKFANDARGIFRKAEIQRKNGDVDSADTSVLEGLHLLNESTGIVSTLYTSTSSRLFMTRWDEDEIKKA